MTYVCWITGNFVCYLCYFWSSFLNKSSSRNGNKNQFWTFLNDMFKNYRSNIAIYHQSPWNTTTNLFHCLWFLLIPTCYLCRRSCRPKIWSAYTHTKSEYIFINSKDLVKQKLNYITSKRGYKQTSEMDWIRPILLVTVARSFLLNKCILWCYEFLLFWKSFQVVFPYHIRLHYSHLKLTRKLWRKNY